MVKTLLGVGMFLVELYFWFTIGLLTHRLLVEHLPHAALWLAIGASLIVIIVWSLFIAPKTPRRLPLVWRLVSVMTVMILVAIGLIVNEETLHGVLLTVAALAIFLPGQIILDGAEQTSYKLK